MSQACLSQISELVAEYGKLNYVDTSGWTISFSRKTCMVWGITAVDEARGLREFLKKNEMLAQVIPPSPVVPEWSVVATV